MHFAHTSRYVAVLLALIALPQAEAAFLDLIVAAGPASAKNSVPPANWGGSVTSGQFLIEDINTADSVFVTTPTAPGLTNTRVTCDDPNGCGAFAFTFTIIGWDMADFPVYLVLDGTHTRNDNIRADYLISCTSSVNCSFTSNADFLLLADQFNEPSDALQPAFPPNTVIPPGTLANLQVFWSFAPEAGGGFDYQDSFELPNSFIVQAAPEPGGVALSLSGLAALLLLRRRRSARTE